MRGSAGAGGVRIDGVKLFVSAAKELKTIAERKIMAK
jgi:hypothetical protein